MAKTALVIGASGQVGNVLYNLLKEKHYNTIGTGCANLNSNLIKLDVKDKEAFNKIYLEYKPLYIYYVSSYNNVDECEKNSDHSRNINVFGFNNLIEIAEKNWWREIHIAYFSTDYVFDGKAGPYIVDNIPNPIQEYGKQKFICERLLIERKGLGSDVIIRTNMVYGFDPQKKNYNSRLHNCLERGETWEALSDEYVTPTFNKTLAERAIALLEHNAIEEGNCKTYHVAGKEITTRYQFSVDYAKVYGFDLKLIKPIFVNDVKRIAKRPIYGGLKCTKKNETRSHMEVFEQEQF